MKSMLARIAALESCLPGARPNREIAEALDRCCKVLEVAMPSDQRRYIDCGTFVRCDYTGWRSSREKIAEMGSRSLEDKLTLEDKALLATLPADALATMKIDARGFVEMLKESYDSI